MCLDFVDRADGRFVDVGDIFDLSTSDWTISAWCWIGPNVDKYQSILAKGRYDGAGDVLIYVYNHLQLVFRNDDSGLGEVPITDGNAKTNVWHHVAVTRKGTKIKTYHNGAQYSSGTLPGDYNFTNTHSWTIGAREDGSEYSWHGFLSDYIIYKDVCLTESQIGTLYRWGKTGSYGFIRSTTPSTVQMAAATTGAGAVLTPAPMTAQSELEQTSITQTHNLQPAPMVSLSGVDQTTLQQLHGVVPAQMLAGVDLEQSGITQAHTLSPDPMRALTELEDAGLGKVIVLQPADMSASVSLSEASLDQVHGVSPEDMTAAVELEASGLQQAHVVVPEDMAARTRLEESALLQTHVLTPDAMRALVEMEDVSAAQLARGYLVVDGVVVAPILMAQGEVEPALDAEADIIPDRER